MAPTLAPRDAVERPWDVRTSSDHILTGPGARAEALADLEGGARVDPGAGRSHRCELAVAVGSADALARVLDGVGPELAAIALDASPAGTQGGGLAGRGGQGVSGGQAGVST